VKPLLCVHICVGVYVCCVCMCLCLPSAWGMFAFCMGDVCLLHVCVCVCVCECVGVWVCVLVHHLSAHLPSRLTCLFRVLMYRGLLATWVCMFVCFLPLTVVFVDGRCVTSGMFLLLLLCFSFFFFVGLLAILWQRVQDPLLPVCADQSCAILHSHQRWQSERNVRWLLACSKVCLFSYPRQLVQSGEWSACLLIYDPTHLFFM
jgi:hypothetical protein